MSYTGIVNGNSIELEQELSIPDGTRVEIEIHAQNGAATGSPESVLQLVGTLNADEPEALRKATDVLRRVDSNMWIARP